MTDDQFFRFCQENDSIQFERDSAGDIILMEPTGSETERFNVNIVTELTLWNRASRMGYVFGNNVGFTLPNTSVRSPDAAFILRSRYDALDAADSKKFAHICPDFVIEIVSGTDQESMLHRKMKEWMTNGCRLAWMINPNRNETTVYRENGETERKPFVQTLYGENVLPGFQVNVAEVFRADGLSG